MSLLSKTKSPFVAPKMLDVDAEYRSRVERYDALHAALAGLRQQQRDITIELGALPELRVAASVAALLGDDQIDMRARLVGELAKVRAAIDDHEAAIELQRKRVDEARAVASRTVCDRVRPEYARRVKAMAVAFDAAEAAREEFMQLTDQLENDEVAWRYLGDCIPHFLGDRREGRVSHWKKEVAQHGYS